MNQCTHRRALRFTVIISDTNHTEVCEECFEKAVKAGVKIRRE